MEHGRELDSKLTRRMHRHAELKCLTHAGGFYTFANSTPERRVEQLAANVLHTAVDVILLDTTFWGGIRPCVKAAGDLRGIPARRGGALVGRARDSARDHAAPRRRRAEPHVRRGRALPPLVDDVIVGGKMQYCHGTIAVPTAPGLGVKLDRDKHGGVPRAVLRLGTYPYDQDPLRPGWAPLIRTGVGRSERRRGAGHSALIVLSHR